MTLKERLEEAARNGHCYLPGDEARKLLALLKAAKGFHEAYGEVDSDNWYSCRDTLLNAIHAVEGA